MSKVDKRGRLNGTVIAVALALLPMTAGAAGLGRLNVLSALGQPLRAELEITATREEMSSLAARLASPDSFKQAGIEYVPALSGIRLAVERRANGEPYVRISSTRSVSEPFLDLLVELTWAQGRLVREYTFLLDPPETLVKPAPAAVTAPEVKREPAAPTARPPETKMPAVVEEKPGKAAEAKPAPAEKGGERLVKRGDTLAKIAGETKPEGTSLDQMLVALFQGNKDAFDADNMHRLKAGKILNIPDAETVKAVDGKDARKIIATQSADFNAYRQKLAAAAAASAPRKEEAAGQAAGGKITPKVEDKAPVAAGQDKLQVSPTAVPKDAKAGGRPGAKEEDLVAREKALKEANTRIAELEKNLSDMKKLADLKSQSLAELQKQAQQAKPAAAPVPPPAPVAAVKPEPPKPVEAAKPAEPAKAAEPAKPAAPVSATETARAPEPAAKPVAPPPPKPAVQTPPVETSFVEENPLLVYGGGGVLVVLLGYLGFSSWKRKRQDGGVETVSRLTEGDLTANSVFGTTGGQRVDTSNSSIQTDFSQSGLGAIDADEGVDPVAEADVYMAYGRDAQAEEILLDALKTDSNRLAIHLKLLEIYAARKSVKQFETLATELYERTAGAGADWDKAATMGRDIDPENPLYATRGAIDAAAVVEEAGATEPQAERLAIHDRDTVTLPGQLGQLAGVAEATQLQPQEDNEAALPGSLDFDLDLDLGAAEPEPTTEAQSAETAASVPAGVDFEVSFDSDAATVPAPGLLFPSEPAAPSMEALDFDLDLEAPAAPEESLKLDDHEAMAGQPKAPQPAHEKALDFDFDLGDTATVVNPTPGIDLSSISLDLDVAPATAPAAPALEAAPDAFGAGDQSVYQEVATKLELAQAYEEMGDREGARELLQEVLAEGNAEQQEAARNKLAVLA